MKLNTASAAVRFSGELEEASARFYGLLQQIFPECREFCQSCIEQNRKFSSEIQQAYYGVISDALEGCFTFENIDTDDFAIPDSPGDSGSLIDALSMAAGMEDTMMKFYISSYEASRSLIADVALVFRKIARKRAERIEKIRTFVTDPGDVPGTGPE